MHHVRVLMALAVQGLSGVSGTGCAAFADHLAAKEDIDNLHALLSLEVEFETLLDAPIA